MINIKCKKCGWMLPFQAKSNKDNVCGRKSIDIVCLKCGKNLIRKGGNVNRWYWLCSDTFRLFCCNLFKPILIFVIVFLVEEKTDIIIIPSKVFINVQIFIFYIIFENLIKTPNYGISFFYANPCLPFLIVNDSHSNPIIRQWITI